MRIGVNLSPLFPSQIGGMEAYAYNLLSHLTAIDRQHGYYLFVARYNRHLFDSQRRWTNVNKVPILSLQGLLYARQIPRLPRSLINAVASAHILYNIKKHELDLWFCPLFNLAPRHVRLASVVSLPDLLPEFHPEFFSKDLLKWSQRRYPASCRDATRVITFSNFSRSAIVERYDIAPGKIHVTPLGVGEEFLLPRNDSAIESVRAMYGLPHEYALYPANTWPRKNHLGLLRALRLLRTKHGTRLVCVFTGAKREGHESFLKAVEEYGLTEQVRHLGYVEKSVMSQLYQGARVLVFPSLYEGFGLPLLEAMASDCPVLCSQVTSLPEVAGDAALLFDPRDPEAIADALHRVLTDTELRRALVRAGATRVQQFSWERTARETLKVLEEAALSESRPPSPQS